MLISLFGIANQGDATQPEGEEFMAQRISEWIPLRVDKQGAGITVIPWRQRPDLTQFANDTLVYEIKDLWTSKDGRWDNPNERFGCPQWAIDTYLKPWVNGQPNPEGIPAGGAATHVLLSCLDEKGDWMPGKGMLFTTERVAAVAQGMKNVDLWTMRPIANDHWYVIEMQKSSVYMPDGSRLPEFGVEGPWVLMPVGLGDIVVGVGLPYSWHVSTFAVWQQMARTGVVVDPPPDVDPPPGGDPLSGSISDLLKQASDALVQASRQAAGMSSSLNIAKIAVIKAQELIG